MKNLLTMPLPLVSGVDTSVMMAVPILMFPLLMPPIILARTNNVKDVESAHTMYDNAIPAWKKSGL